MDQLMKEEFKPLSFWSFNGDMEDEEVRTQVRQLKEQGYGGFFMHARAGMTLEYLGDAWFHACRVAVEEAKEQGLKAWLYDENGWPSGFAGGLVPALGKEYTAKHLHFVYGEPTAADGEVLAAYRELEDGSFERIISREPADMYCCMEEVMGYADLLNGKAMDAFIRFTHERYYEEFGEYFGNVIPGIFTDEPQLMGKFPYTFAFPEKFSQVYGYDFFDKAWMLEKDGLEYAEFKYQASKLVADLLCESFTNKIDVWCREHNLIFTGHFPNEDGLAKQSTTCYNLMNQYAYMERPGIDFLGRRLTSPVLVKQVSDAAYLSGKNMITSESFGCSGWDVTFNDLLWVSDWQSAFGINSIVTHLSAYSMKGRRKRDYPAFFSYQEPWWEIFKEVSEHIAKVNTFMSEGKREVKMLVLYPITSIWCMIAGKDTYSDETRNIANQFRLLMENLLDLQKDFLVLTEEQFTQFTCKDGMITNGEICCKTVIVPDSLSWNESTYTKLQTLGEQKGSVVFMNRRPVLCEGRKTKQAEDVPACVVDNRRGFLEKYLLSSGETDTLQVVDGFYGQPASGLIVSKRILEKETRVLVMNPSRCDSKKVYLKLVSENGEDRHFPLTLEPTESRCIVVKNLCAYTEQGQLLQAQEMVNSRKLEASDVQLLSPNAYNINHCDVYLNGEQILEHVIPAVCADEVYERAYASGEQSTVKLRYVFQADFKKKIPDNLVCVAESEGISSLQINGTEVLQEKADWWIDKSFHVFPIAEHTVNGENIIEMTFEITRPKELEEQGEFEGYKNRFFYPIEPEDVYIRGDFDVQVQGEITNHVEDYRIKGAFVLTDSTGKNAGELTGQNLWFYCGNARYTYKFTAGNKNQVLHISHMEATAAEVLVNGKKAGMICRAPYKLDVSDYMTEGENTVELVLYGSNRNLLGPHHHVSGNPHFVGVSTFLGERDWTDFINPQIVETNTHMEAYSFVHFHTGSVKLEEYTNI